MPSDFGFSSAFRNVDGILARGAAFSSVLILAGLASRSGTFVRLEIGILALAFAGVGAMSVMRVGVGSAFAMVFAALVAQQICLAYLYLRLFAARFMGLPAVGNFEVPLLVAVLICAAIFRSVDLKLPAPRLRSGAVLRQAFRYSLWIGLLWLILKPRLGLWQTASSDPDLHAYLAKALADSGLAEDFYPRSDVLTIYPGGFAILNYLWMKLSGLSSVQIVNFQPFLQMFLMAGSIAGWLVDRTIRRKGLSFELAIFFTIATVAMAPPWLEGHQFSEGTGRLSHSAILCFPWLLLLTHRRTKHVAVLPLAAFSAAFGGAINPSHLAPALLFLVLGPLLNLISWSWRRWVCAAILCVASYGLIVANDPFFRSKFTKSDRYGQELTYIGSQTEKGVQSSPPALLKPFSAQTWTDNLIFTFKNPAVLFKLSHIRGAPSLACLGLAALIFFLIIGRNAAFDPAIRMWAKFTFGYVIIATFGNVTVQSLISPASLAGALLVDYTNQAIEIALRCLYPGLVFGAFLLARNRAWAGSSGGAVQRTSKVLGGLFCIAIVISTFSVAKRQWKLFRPFQAVSSFGTITPDTLALVGDAKALVGAGERVLIRGWVSENFHERWMFPGVCGRALALYSEVLTAFFYGVDGMEFTAENYRAHFEKTTDRPWLNSKKIGWVCSAEPLDDPELELVRQHGAERLYRFKLR